MAGWTNRWAEWSVAPGNDARGGGAWDGVVSILKEGGKEAWHTGRHKEENGGLVLMVNFVIAERIKRTHRF